MRIKPQYKKPEWPHFAIQEDEAGIRLKKRGFEILQPGIYSNWKLWSRRLIARIPTDVIPYDFDFHSITSDRVEIKSSVNLRYKISKPAEFMQNIPEAPVDYESEIIAKRIISNANQIMIAYPLEGVSNKRKEIEGKIIETVREPLKNCGIVVDNLGIVKFELPDCYALASERQMALELENKYKTKELELFSGIASQKAELTKREIAARIESLKQIRAAELEGFRQQKEVEVGCLEDYAKVAIELQQKPVDCYLALKEKEAQVIAQLVKEVGQAMGSNNPREVLWALFQTNSRPEEMQKFGVDFKIIERLQKEIENENERALLELEKITSGLKGEVKGLERAVEEKTIIKEVCEELKEVGMEPGRYFEIKALERIPQLGLDVNLASRQPGQLKKIDKRAYPHENPKS